MIRCLATTIAIKMRVAFRHNLYAVLARWCHWTAPAAPPDANAGCQHRTRYYYYCFRANHRLISVTGLLEQRVYAQRSQAGRLSKFWFTQRQWMFCIGIERQTADANGTTATIALIADHARWRYFRWLTGLEVPGLRGYIDASSFVVLYCRFLGYASDLYYRFATDLEMTRGDARAFDPTVLHNIAEVLTRCHTNERWRLSGNDITTLFDPLDALWNTALDAKEAVAPKTMKAWLGGGNGLTDGWWYQFFGEVVKDSYVHWRNEFREPVTLTTNWTSDSDDRAAVAAATRTNAIMQMCKDTGQSVETVNGILKDHNGDKAATEEAIAAKEEESLLKHFQKKHPYLGQAVDKLDLDVVSLFCRLCLVCESAADDNRVARLSAVSPTTLFKPLDPPGFEAVCGLGVCPAYPLPRLTHERKLKIRGFFDTRPMEEAIPIDTGLSELVEKLQIN